MKNTLDSTMMAYVDTVNLSLPENRTIKAEQQSVTTSNTLFHNATKLHFAWQEGFKEKSLRYLSSFIDFSKIVYIESTTIGFYYLDEVIDIKKDRIASSILQAPNLRSLTIEYLCYGDDSRYDGDEKYFTFTEKIYSLLPFHIKHLEIPIKDVNQIEIVFERCQQLISVRFELHENYYGDEEGDEKLGSKIVKWFSKNTLNSTYKFQEASVVVWIGQKKIITEEVSKKTRKRIKLTDKHDRR